jgi:hypothetical protein
MLGWLTSSNLADSTKFWRQATAETVLNLHRLNSNSASLTCPGQQMDAPPDAEKHWLGAPPYGSHTPLTGGIPVGAGVPVDGTGVPVGIGVAVDVGDGVAEAVPVGVGVGVALGSS